MLTDFVIFTFYMKRNTNIFNVVKRFLLQGLFVKIFHCLKMPHSDSELVLNFVDPVPIAIKKITARERGEHSEVLLFYVNI